MGLHLGMAGLSFLPRDSCSIQPNGQAVEGTSMNPIVLFLLALSAICYILSAIADYIGV